MVSNVALTMLILRPSTCPSAVARSASQPTTVWPSDPMNSFGAYVASAATASVPFALTAAGTWAAIELTSPDGLAGDVVPVLVPVPLPHPAARTAMNKNTVPVAHNLLVL